MPIAEENRLLFDLSRAKRASLMYLQFDLLFMIQSIQRNCDISISSLLTSADEHKKKCIFRDGRHL